MTMNGKKCHNITFSKGYNIFGALNFTGNQTYLNSFKLKSSFFKMGLQQRDWQEIQLERDVVMSQMQ